MNAPLDFSQPPPFHSLAELRAAHSELLGQYHQLQDAAEAEAADQPLTAAFLAHVWEFVRRGQAAGAVIDSSEERWDAQSLLDFWATVLYRSASELERDQVRLTLAAFDPQQAPLLEEKDCPYLGLLAFHEKNQRYFFGRQQVVKDLLGKLANQPLLAITGPSGSGKSSLVLAGLLPQLRGGALPGSADWQYFPPLVPGAAPLASLAALFNPPQATAAWAQEQNAAFKRDAAHLCKLVEAAGSQPAVLVIDQFEEVFTLAEPAEVQALVRNLQTLLQARRHVLVLTLRSEFYPKTAQLKDFAAALAQARYEVMPLSASQLREAIEEPARLINLKFAEGIVDALVNEILGEPAGLPLLQFTLRELWRLRDHNRITRRAYESLGGARQALSNVADQFYEALAPQEQAVVRRVLVRLGWTDGTAEVLRNRVTRDILQRVGGAATDAVLARLVVANLLHVTPDPAAPGGLSPSDQFEVTHEALIRNWHRLVRWLEDERATLHQRLLLKAAAEHWREHGDGLLPPARLAEALSCHDLDKTEEAFVRASQQALEEAERAEEVARQREIQQAKELAEAERQRANAEVKANRRLKWSFVSAVCLLALATSIAVYAWQQRRHAETSKLAAEVSAKLATEQTKLAKEAAAKAELRRAEAEQARKDAEQARQEAERQTSLAQEAKRKAEIERQKAWQLQQHSDQLAQELQVKNKELESKSTELAKHATNQKQRAADLADALGKEQAAKDEMEAQKKIVEAAAETLKREQALTKQELEHSQAVQVQAANEHLQKLREAERTLLTSRSIATFSPDGKRMLTITNEGRLQLSEVGSKQVLREFVGDSPLTSVAIDANGKYIATAETKRTLTLWDAHTGNKLRTWVGPADVTQLAFSPDAQRLAVASYSGESRILETSTGRLLHTFTENRRPLVNLAFNRTGDTLALTNAAREVSFLEISANGNSTVRRVSDTACRSSDAQVLSISPARDLRVGLAIRVTCLAEQAPPNTTAVAKKLTPKQVVKVEEVAGVEPNQAKTLGPPAAAAAEPTVKRAPPQPASANPAAPAASGNVRKAAATDSDRQMRVLLNVRKRLASGEWEPLTEIDYAYESTGSPEVNRLVSELLAQGPTPKQVKEVSDLIYDYRDELEDLQKDALKAQQDAALQSAYQAKVLALANQLLKKLLAVFSLPTHGF